MYVKSAVSLSPCCVILGHIEPVPTTQVCPERIKSADSQGQEACPVAGRPHRAEDPSLHCAAARVNGLQRSGLPSVSTIPRLKVYKKTGNIWRQTGPPRLQNGRGLDSQLIGEIRNHGTLRCHSSRYFYREPVLNWAIMRYSGVPIQCILRCVSSAIDSFTQRRNFH